VFHDIPAPVEARMDELHRLNVRQRAEGMPRLRGNGPVPVSGERPWAPEARLRD